MNKLQKQLKHHFFSDKAAYLAFRAHWSRLLNSERRHDLSAAHHLLYAALIGRDWRQGFTLTGSQRKIENGAFAGWELFRALRLLHSAYHEAWLQEPFAGLITQQMMVQLRPLLPQIQPYRCDPADFRDRHFPFPAFVVPEEMITTEAEESAIME